MKVLWIVHDVMEPYFELVKGKPTKGGSWIAPLFNSLHSLEDIQLGILTSVYKGIIQKLLISDIPCYIVPRSKDGNTKVLQQDLIRNYIVAINDFKPDLIHIHGTESNFGLIRKFVDPNIPIVCSIQGIKSVYSSYLYSQIRTLSIQKFRSIKNYFGYGGELVRLRKWIKYSHIENEIFKLNLHFIGRTDWDKAHTKFLNPAAKYYQGEELLRTPFYHKTWNINQCNRFQIFASSAAYPIKGFHVLLKSLSLLRDKYPTIKVIVPLSNLSLGSSLLKDTFFSDDYSNYLKKQVRKYKLQQNIVFLSRLSAEQMAEMYQSSHAFVLPSIIENSPNSLGEAMIVGTPSISSAVGGVMSIIQNEKSGLLFPSDDAVYLAYQLDRIFSDDNLAVQLSENARKVAAKRHDVVETTLKYKNIYVEILNSNCNEVIGNKPM